MIDSKSNTDTWSKHQIFFFLFFETILRTSTKHWNLIIFSEKIYSWRNSFIFHILHGNKLSLTLTGANAHDLTLHPNLELIGLLYWFLLLSLINNARNESPLSSLSLINWNISYPREINANKRDCVKVRNVNKAFFFHFFLLLGVPIHVKSEHHSKNIS